MGFSKRFQTPSRIAVILLAAFLAIQFIRPNLSSRSDAGELQTSPEVSRILRTSCYNCHSNHTQLAWFDQIVPAYWIVVRDVNLARTHLNFSNLGTLPPASQRALLYEAVNQIQLGGMPLPSYKRLHPEAEVKPEDVAVLRRYLSPPVSATVAEPGKIIAADTQYRQWVQAGNARPAVQAVANGIAFMPEYKNWKAISSTERFDNKTMRVILGNDVAVKAIAENRIKPWPDGTKFAKVAWLQQEDGQGFVRTGAFVQVEFMIRDSKKYASTKGWGWARWRGADLKPYGKDASFSNECVSCHLPLRDTDYVYTAPLRGQQ